MGYLVFNSSGTSPVLSIGFLHEVDIDKGSESEGRKLSRRKRLI